MHNNAEFLSRFSSREMRFHLRKSVVTFAKNIYIFRLTEHSLHKNFGSSKRSFQENEIA